MKALDRFPIFDSHLHIIDSYFPLIENNGYLPDEYTCNDYVRETSAYQLCGGAIVSGSFQVYDQGYLIEALKTLGDDYVGVTQLPIETTDQEILALNDVGVRAVRFNMKRGGSEELRNLASMASRIYELANWHVELYVDSKDIESFSQLLLKLPEVSIDHLGLSLQGMPELLKLIEKGVHVKATGFSRVDFDVRSALKDIQSANPYALMFGTDLPSTRAPSRYTSVDFELVADALDVQAAMDVFSRNAIKFYRPSNATLRNDIAV